MGIRLIVEMLDYAPPDLTPAERLVLVVIAETARDEDPARRGAPGMEQLMRRTGLTSTALRHALQRLAKRALDVRVALGVDSRGRPFYTGPGRCTEYQLPALAAAAMAAPGGHQTPEWRPQEATKQAGMVAPGGRPSPKSKELLLQQAVRTIQEQTDATNAEAWAVIAMVEAEKTPRNLTGFLVNLGKNPGELQDWVDRHRAAAARVSQGVWLDQLDRLPECQHGTPGGDVARPSDGWRKCPVCRRQHGVAA